MFSRESRRVLRATDSPHSPLELRPPFQASSPNDGHSSLDAVYSPIPASFSSTSNQNSSPLDASGSIPSRPTTPSSASAGWPPHIPQDGAFYSDDLDEGEEDIPSTVRQASSESALFAPTSSLSRHKVSHLDRRFHEAERRAERVGLREVRAGIDIALGVRRLYKAEQDKSRRRRNSFGGDSGADSTSYQTLSRTGVGIGIVGQAFETLERRLEDETTVERGGIDRLSLSGDRKPSLGAQGPQSSNVNVERAVARAVGVAGVVGLAGLGWEWYKRHERDKSRLGPEGEVVRPASAPARSPVTPHSRSSSPFTLPETPQSSSPLLGPVPMTLSSATPSSTPIFISHLSPVQHKTLQHAAAALLLKHHERHHRTSSGGGKIFHHDEIGIVVGAVVGGWHELARLVETGLGKVGARKSHRLFGVDLKELTKHEGVVSRHGIDPNSRGLRIPEFLDHLITALKQSDMSVPGILRKSANVRKVLQIIDALDHSDGSGETVLDLAKLDPVTLADLFQRFLGALPHPVFTHHLFGLFVATSHIHHPGLRRRAMHLVICLMPKANRDVMECVFLFLTWLSKHAHVSVIDGQKLDLTGIATIMAPILLSPKNRNPHPTELNSMIAAVLNLLEDQHILHEIPFELAHLLHIEPPATTTLRRSSLLQSKGPASPAPPPSSSSIGSSTERDDVAGFIRHLLDRL